MLLPLSPSAGLQGRWLYGWDAQLARYLNATASLGLAQRWPELLWRGRASTHPRDAVRWEAPACGVSAVLYASPPLGLPAGCGMTSVMGRCHLGQVRMLCVVWPCAAPWRGSSGKPLQAGSAAGGPARLNPPTPALTCAADPPACLQGALRGLPRLPSKAQQDGGHQSEGQPRLADP